MTVLDETSSERSGPFYVRLQNLPVSAGQKQIREFFKDLTIPDGGISINRTSAFAVFDNETDALAAVSKDKELIDGRKIRILNAVLKDVRRTKAHEVRRKLDFGPPEQSIVLKQKKRIRPTKVKECTGMASKKFCPDEIEFPVKIRDASLVDIKSTEILFNSSNKEILSLKTGLRLPNEKVPTPKPKPCQLVVKVDGNRARAQDEVRNNTAHNFSAVTDQIIEKVPESCFLENSCPEKSESKLLDKSVQKNMSSSLDGNVINNKNESFYANENYSRKVKLDEKVTGQIANSGFAKKVRDVTNRFPVKKTIKPTSVLTLNQFKLAYEGTVF